MRTDDAQSDARSAIFASIRENLSASAQIDALEHGHPGTRAMSLEVTDGGTVDVLDAFRESLEMVGARCEVVENENEAASRLVDVVERFSATRVAISDSELVHRVVEAARIEAIKNASREVLFSSEIGITSAQWAIAETGTLVLESGSERHRLVSLVPPVHVCVLMARSIRRSMTEILEMADTNANRTITFITGASRTSDIELTLAIGVHGPGELHVIVIKDQ